MVEIKKYMDLDNYLKGDILIKKFVFDGSKKYKCMILNAKKGYEFIIKDLEDNKIYLEKELKNKNLLKITLKKKMKKIGFKDNFDVISDIFSNIKIQVEEIKEIKKEFLDKKDIPKIISYILELYKETDFSKKEGIIGVNINKVISYIENIGITKENFKITDLKFVKDNVVNEFYYSEIKNKELLLSFTTRIYDKGFNNRSTDLRNFSITIPCNERDDIIFSEHIVKNSSLENPIEIGSIKDLSNNNSKLEKIKKIQVNSLYFSKNKIIDFLIKERFYNKEIDSIKIKYKEFIHKSSMYFYSYDIVIVTPPND